jgi:hypothetical protein
MTDKRSISQITQDETDSIDLAEEIDRIYTILEECCGASPLEREAFSRYMTAEHRQWEWRFGGWLGFGGKLYADSRSVHVDYYREDRTPIRDFAVKTANERISRRHSPLARA